LGEGDQILTTDQEYGAMEKMWTFVCGRRDCQIIRSSIPLPVESDEQVVEAIWRGVTARTRVLFISHIVSPTALTLPVASLVARAKEQGIITVIDGAHGPGQLDVNLDELNADFYVGNCHKWMMAPKGAGFLYVHPDYQSQVEPLVASWGWHTERARGSYLVDCLEYQGTRDISAFLTVPAAIDFMDKYGWEAVRAECQHLITATSNAILDITGKPAIYPGGCDWYQQMAAFWLPEIDGHVLQRRLYDEFRIEVPVTSIETDQFLRISVQGYNTVRDLEKLVTALGQLLPEVSG
jgi:isopenicillin-N epimerase